MPDTAEALDISGRSHWLRQALLQDASVAPPLYEAITADICIVGGGYLGLWTAIHLKDSAPSVDVVIIEQDICGGGPSGRNSGMLLSAWPKATALAALRCETRLEIVPGATHLFEEPGTLEEVARLATA